MEKYLSICLDSLIIKNRELFKKLEVLVVNDGSKDASSAIAHKYQKSYPDVYRVIDKENGNYGSCINRGLKEAKGKYVKILDSDDRFETTNFEEYVSYLNEIDADLILSDFQQVNISGKVLYTWKLYTEGVITVKDIDPLKMQMHSITYKTSNLLNSNYVQSEGISYTDTEWMFMPMLTVRYIAYFPKVIYKYLVGRDGQTIDEITVANRIEQIIYIIKRMFSNYDGIQCEDENVNNYMSGCINRMLRFAYYIILISGRCQINTQKLADFDIWLKTNYPSYYTSLDSIKAHPLLNYYYVKDWRYNSYRDLNKKQLRKLSFFNQLDQLKSKLKSVLLYLLNK